MATDNNCGTNVDRIEKRIRLALDILGESYELRECDVGDLAVIPIANFEFHIRQFEIKGVGNLLVMSSTNDGPMQMDTVTLTPYFKNLPLFTTDYIYQGDNRSFLNEIYDLVPYKDDLYEGYIGKFASNCAQFAHLMDLKPKPCWYDDIRPVFVYKAATSKDDEALFDIFEKNLRTFIEMEKASPSLPDDVRKKKWECNREYARKLVDEGGVSTQTFVQAIGAEKTKKLFYSVFFAPDLYSN